MNFSTDHVRPQDRLARLQAELAAQLTPADCVAGVPPQAFHVSWSGTAGARLALAHGRAHGLQAWRDARRVRDGADPISLYILRAGSLAAEQGRHRHVLRPGEAVVIDEARVVSNTWHHAETLILRMPRPAGFEGEHAGRRLEAADGALRLLRPFLAGIGPGPLDPDTEAMMEALGALAVAAATPRRPALREAVAAARLAAMRNLLWRRAAEPGLGMAGIAAAVGVSERRGHQLFEAAGLTFRDELNAARLEQLHARLASAPAASIAALSLECGFGDISHCNRLFRARFGRTPSEVRRETGVAQGV